MMLIRAAALTFLAILTISSSAFASGGDSILGVWWTPTKDGKFEIYRSEDNRYFGKILGGDGPEQFDTKNPDPDLQSRSLIGVNFLSDFSYDSDKAQWVDGTIYDPNNGRTYDCKMWLDENDATKLNARGFLGISAFGRTEVFTRVEGGDAQAGQ